MEKIPPIVKTYVGKGKEITLHIPNVGYAKKNHLLLKKRGITHEMIKRNMELCGFDVVTYGEHKGTKSKITTKCCKPDCDGTAEKTYNNFITNQEIPYCKSCASIVRGINISNKRPVVAIRNNERFEFESVEEAARQLNFTGQSVYHSLRNCTIHSSGYRFEFLD